jgi:hypothetical protein
MTATGFAIVPLICLSAAGQQLAPEVLALSRASRLAGDTVDALANCVCLESVSRSRIDKKGEVKREERDALQIEVATIGDREWFSWLGRDDAFVENPSALVGFGFMSSGQFTSNLRTVFMGGFARRKFHAAVTFHARSALQYDYTVSSNFTHYTVSGPHGGVRAGIQGSFWIDAQTNELLALSSEATEIPPDFEIRSVRADVVYAPMYLADRRVVLPQTATTLVEHAGGTLSVNQLEFSHCRPYSNSSSIRFDDAATPSSLPPAASQPPVHNGQTSIPAGLSLLTRLERPLTSASAIGERFSLVMEADARSRGGTVIAKGAKVEGRVRWIEASTCPAPCLVVAVELLSATAADGNSHPLYASLRQAAPESKVKLAVSQVARTLTELPFGLRRMETSSLSIEVPRIPGVGSFFVLTPDLTTPPDLVLTWLTESPRHP